MKQFVVEEEYIAGKIHRVEVASGGEPVGDPYEVEDDSVDYDHPIILGYNVFELNEGGTTNNVGFYPIATDMVTFKNNAEDVLEQIKRDYPAGEWQNNSW